MLTCAGERVDHCRVKRLSRTRCTVQSAAAASSAALGARLGHAHTALVPLLASYGVELPVPRLRIELTVSEPSSVTPSMRWTGDRILASIVSMVISFCAFT
jgi:hypothetical protein